MQQAHQELQNRYAIQAQEWQTLKQDNITYQALNAQLKQQIDKAENVAKQQAQFYEDALNKHQQEQQAQLAQAEKIYGAHVSDIKEAAENQRHRMILELDDAKTAAKRNQQDLIKWQEDYMALKQKQQSSQATNQELKEQLLQLQAEKQTGFQTLIQTISEQTNQLQQLLTTQAAQARFLENIPAFEQALIAMQIKLEYILQPKDKEILDDKH